MAQGFSQRLSVDYQETFSPVRDAITLHYLISFMRNLKCIWWIWLQTTFMDHSIMRYIWKLLKDSKFPKHTLESLGKFTQLDCKDHCMVWTNLNACGITVLLSIFKGRLYKWSDLLMCVYKENNIWVCCTYYLCWWHKTYWNSNGTS